MKGVAKKQTSQGAKHKGARNTRISWRNRAKGHSGRKAVNIVGSSFLRIKSRGNCTFQRKKNRGEERGKEIRKGGTKDLMVNKENIFKKSMSGDEPLAQKKKRKR